MYSFQVMLRLSLKLFIKGHCQSQGGEQKVGGSARATQLFVKGICPYSPGFVLPPDKYNEKNGTF